MAIKISDLSYRQEFKRFSSLLICLFILTSCQSSSISVQTQYVTHQSLASYHVRTPDPRLQCPDIGQRLLISWSIPPSYLTKENLHLLVKIRFRNREENFFSIPIDKRRGTSIYNVLNQDFWTTKGILTYKVELIGEDELLDEWRHQLWVELIHVD